LHDALTERSFGSAEGMPYSRDFDVESVADAEDREALRARLRTIWDYLQTIPAQNILVVSHGSAGRMLRNVVLPDIPFHGTSEAHHLPNAQIVQLI
jgi:broad specificity phosphatase PhoE